MNTAYGFIPSPNSRWRYVGKPPGRGEILAKACALIDCWGPAYRGFNPKKISKTNDGQ